MIRKDKQINMRATNRLKDELDAYAKSLGMSTPRLLLVSTAKQHPKLRAVIAEES